jgi:outer membrane lipase/esterase
LDFDGYPGLPGGDGVPQSFTVGTDYQIAPGLLVGVAASYGHVDVDFGRRPDGADLGGFDQTELALSAYLALKVQSASFDVVGTWGTLEYDTTRTLPMGIATRQVDGSTDGVNWSIAGQAAYDFKWKAITHGPIAGLTYQDVDIDGFVESAAADTPAYLALAFGDQSRTSLVSSLGWRVSWDAGMFVPFAKALWKHELASTDRNVTATLVDGALPTLVGPLSYSLPAIDVGRDWAFVTIGTEVKFSPDFSGVISANGTFGQEDFEKYGVQLGFRVKY